MNSSSENRDSRAKSSSTYLGLTAGRSALDQRLSWKCETLVTTARLWAQRYRLAWGKDDAHEVAREMVRHLRAKAMESIRYVGTQPSMTGMLAKLHAIVEQMCAREMSNLAEIPTSDYLDAMYRAIWNNMCDVLVFNTLTMGASSASIGQPHPLTNKERAAAKRQLAAFGQVKQTLSIEHQRVLAMFERYDCDVLMMARQLGIWPREARVSLRQTADNLIELLFHQQPSSGVAAGLTAAPYSSLRTHQLDEEEMLTLLKERSVFLYIGALNRGDFEQAGSILQETASDSHFEQTILDVNHWLEGETFSRKSRRTAPHSRRSRQSSLKQTGSQGATLSAGTHVIDASTPSQPYGGPAIDNKRSYRRGQTRFILATLKLLHPLPMVNGTSFTCIRINIMLELAALHLMMDTYEDMEQCLNQALTLAIEAEDHAMIATCACWHVANMVLRDNLARARSYCLFGLDQAALAKEKGIPLDNAISQNLARTWKKLNRRRSAPSNI